MAIEQFTGSAIGMVLSILVLVLAIAWLFVPIWIYQIRNDTAKQLKQQTKMIEALTRMDRESREDRVRF